MADPTPVLDLQTLIERPKIAIDGENYEILSPEELSAVDHQRFASEGRRLDALQSRDELRPREKTTLTELIVGLSDRIMVGVPEEIRAKLTETHRLAVLEVFTQLPLQAQLTQLLAAGALRNAPAPISTGAKRRRGSSASTAATRPGGSTRRPSRSSGPT